MTNSMKSIVYLSLLPPFFMGRQIRFSYKRVETELKQLPVRMSSEILRNKVEGKKQFKIDTYIFILCHFLSIGMS